MGEDVHFYIDNAPPDEVMYVLRCLSSSRHLGSTEIADILLEQYGFEMQRDRNYAPRRLFDLGLASQHRRGSGVFYTLTPLGSRVQAIASTDRPLGYELLHLLHFYGYAGRPEDRKLFWSYRRLCELLWSDRHIRPSKEVASSIQSLIEAEFTEGNLVAKAGYRFPHSGVNHGLAWLRALEPSPIADGDLVARGVLNPMLAPLVIDYYYRDHGVAYGSAVVLNNDVLDALSSALFVGPTAFREMTDTASRLSPRLQMSETLGGASVRLTQPFAVADVSLT